MIFTYILILMLTIGINIIALTLLKNKIYRLSVIPYLAYTTLVLFLLMLNPYNNILLSGRVYIIFLVNMSMFFLGFYLYINLFKPQNKDNLEWEIGLFETSNKYLRGLQFLTLIILLYYAVKFNKNILEQGAENARNIRFSTGLLFNSTLEVIFYDWVIGPIIILTNCLFAYNISKLKLFNLDTLIYGVNIVLYFMVGYGRFNLFMVSILIGIMYMLFKDRKIAFRKMCMIIGILFIIFTMGVYITAKRRGMYEFDLKFMLKTVDVFIEQIITYITNPLLAFDIALDTWVDSYKFTLGRLSLGGIDQIIGTLLNGIGIEYSIINEKIGVITREMIYVGKYTFNAFYTANLNYYIDFGIAGIMIIPGLCGMSMGYIAKRLITKKNNSYLVLYVCCIYWFILSNIRWEFQNVGPWIIIIFIVFVNKLKWKRTRTKI